MRFGLTRALPASLAAFLSIAWLAGCSAPAPATGIYVVLSTDLGDVDELELLASGPGMQVPESRRLAIGMAPLRVVLSPSSGSAPDAEVSITARALTAGTVQATRVVETAYLPGEIRILEIQLGGLCTDLACEEECDGAEGCVMRRVSPRDLGRWGAQPVDAGPPIDGGVRAPDGGAPRDGGADAEVDGGAPSHCFEPADVDLPDDDMCEPPSTIATCAAPFECEPGASACTLQVRADSLTAGDDHTCTWCSSGSRVLCWGQAAGNRLGGPSLGSPLTRAVVVRGIEDATAVAAGDDFTCAVHQGGRITCWGRSAAEWGTCESGMVDIELPDDSAPARLAAGDGFACAITASRNVYCWGEGGRGELGQPLASSAVPVRVLGPEGVSGLSAGSHHACAWSPREAWCWGANDHGQLGAGDAAPHESAVRVTQLGEPPYQLRMVASGGRHTCALLDAGAGARVRCWGADDAGQLDGSSSGVLAAVAAERAVPDAVSLGAGDDHTCVSHADERATCWGRDVEDQCGPDGAAAGERRAVGAIVGGRAHTCFMDVYGVLCRGDNSVGQMGTNTSGLIAPYKVDGLR